MRIFQFRPHDTRFPFPPPDFLVTKGGQCVEGTRPECIKNNGDPATLRSWEPLLENGGPITKWRGVMARLAVVVSLLGLSPLGCHTHTLQGTDRNIKHVSASGTMTDSGQGPQGQAVAPSHPASPSEPAVRNDVENLAGPLTLETLERLARENNLTLVQAQTQIEGERAKALQAGLYPNPLVGYIGEQIGAEGTAGEFQGGFVQQEIVTAGKLRLSREKYLARASAAEIQALGQEYRVINEVRIRFYRTLGAQERLIIQRELLKNAEDALVTVQEMLNVGQANRADLHQAKVLLEDQQLNVKRAENDLALEWEWLITVVGVPRPLEALGGSLEGQQVRIHWETALRRLLAESPELGVVRAKLKADELTVKREKVEPIPNLILQGSAGHSYETRDTVYGVGAFIELPIFDRNQGTIRQAQADLRRQQAEVRLTELRLRRSLAAQFQQYRTALQHVGNYRDVILPEARDRYTTRLKSYGENRGTWPAVLEAQQDFFLRRLIYIDHLVAWQGTRVAIDGLLLVDGLASPAGVTVPGHIDAVPKPR